MAVSLPMAGSGQFCGCPAPWSSCGPGPPALLKRFSTCKPPARIIGAEAAGQYLQLASRRLISEPYAYGSNSMQRSPIAGDFCAAAFIFSPSLLSESWSGAWTLSLVAECPMAFSKISLRPEISTHMKSAAMATQMDKCCER